MDWYIDIEGAVLDRRFDFTLRRGAETIPATFWNAAHPAGRDTPVTLLQHGGPLHKRHERTEWLAETAVAGTGGAVLLIDGPIHGRRRDDDPELMEMFGIFKRYWHEDAGIDGMVADWKAALDAVIAQGWADPERVAWLGVSMGTAYGIPVCVADERIGVAAMGMWGTEWGQTSRLLDDARRLKTPVLFQIKVGDEIFSTAGQRELFDALGSPNKCLHTHPGGHNLEASGQLNQLLGFIADHFTAVSQRRGVATEGAPA